MGLAAAVLIDATIIRGVLLPAVMALLGERNWYLPKWLHRMPDLTHDESPTGAGAGAPVTKGGVGQGSDRSTGTDHGADEDERVRV